MRATEVAAPMLARVFPPKWAGQAPTSVMKFRLFPVIIKNNLYTADAMASAELNVA